jgi:hypothetical protein
MEGGLSFDTILITICIILVTILVLDGQKTKKKIAELKPAPSPLDTSMSRVASEPTKINELSMERIVSESAELGTNVVRVCITGGPCAGKTTSLSRIAERVQEFGWRVFTVPEAATLL